MRRTLQAGLLIGMALLIGLALTPAPTQAAVAAQVQVVNPSTSPVPVQVTAVPYYEDISWTISHYLRNASFPLPSTAGKRYLIKYISVTCSSSESSNTYTVYFYGSKVIPGGVGTFLTPVMTLNPGLYFGGAASIGSSNVSIYSDGDSMALEVFRDQVDAAYCSGYVTGEVQTP